MPAIVDKEKCDGCKTCVDTCPNGAITVPEAAETKAEINADECIDCGACVDACPSQAISMAD